MEKSFKILRPGEEEPSKQKIVSDLKETNPSKQKIITDTTQPLLGKKRLMTLEEIKNKPQSVITELNEPRDEEATEKFRIFYKIALAKELAQRTEPIPFSGIKMETYNELKGIEEEFPDYCVPVDPLLRRFRSEGFKVVFGEHPESGNVFIIPSQSMDIINDNLFPRHLDIKSGLDEDLKKLILLDSGKK